MTIKAKRKTLEIFGGKVWVKIYQGSDERWCCEWDDNHDSRRDIQTYGYGDTEAEAIKAYVASCHKREQLPPGTLYR